MKLEVREYRRGRVLCMCGCGETAPIAPQTSRRRGWVRGRPRPYRVGHHRRVEARSTPDYKVDSETGCWVWQKYCCPVGGYGQINNRGTPGSFKAHRWYYEQYVGPIPDGMEIDHLCRNTACVNPTHLEPVPHSINVQRSTTAKLSPAQVAEIRAANPGKRYWGAKDFAVRFGVSGVSVRNARWGRTWKESS